MVRRERRFAKSMMNLHMGIVDLVAKDALVVEGLCVCCVLKLDWTFRGHECGLYGEVRVVPEDSKDGVDIVAFVIVELL